MPISNEELSFRKAVISALQKLLKNINDIINFEFTSDIAPYKIIVTDTGDFSYNKFDIEIENNSLIIHMYRRFLVGGEVSTPEDYELVPTTKFVPFLLSNIGLWMKVELVEANKYIVMMLAEVGGEAVKVTEIPKVIELKEGDYRRLVIITIGVNTSAHAKSRLTFTIRLPVSGVYTAKKEELIRTSLGNFLKTITSYNEKFGRNWQIQMVRIEK